MNFKYLKFSGFLLALILLGSLSVNKAQATVWQYDLETTNSWTNYWSGSGQTYYTTSQFTATTTNRTANWIFTNGDTTDSGGHFYSSVYPITTSCYEGNKCGRISEGASYMRADGLTIFDGYNSLNLDTAVSIGSAVKLSSATPSTYYRAIWVNYSVGSAMIEIGSDGKVKCQTNEGGWNSGSWSSSAYDFTSWHSLVCSWTSSDNKMTLYVDGVQAAQDTFTYPFTGHTFGVINSNPSVFAILGSGWLGQNSERISQLSYYDNVLIANEIKTSVSFVPTPPASSDYLLYYGNYFSYTPLNLTFDLPVVYDVCDSYGTSTGNLLLTINNSTGDYPFTPQLLTSCSGAVRYNQWSGFDEFNGDYFMEIDNMDDGYVYATSSPLNLTVYAPVISGSYIVKDTSNLFVVDTYPSSGTSTLAFHYNVCNDSAYSNSSRIYLNNRDTNGLTAQYITTSSCVGSSTVQIPYSKNLYYYFNADLVFQNASSTLSVRSDPFIIGFSPLSKPRNASSSALFDVSAHDMACSASEWADIENTDNWFNLNGVKCHIFETGLNIAFVIADTPKGVASAMIDVVKIMFPFNLPVQVRDAYMASTSDLPAALDYFDIADENGNYSIIMPAEWDPSGTSTRYVVFGSSVISPPNSPENRFFSGIKAFSTYIIWFGFIWFIIALGISIKEHFTGEVEGDFVQVGLSYNSKGEMSTQWKPRND